MCKYIDIKRYLPCILQAKSLKTVISYNETRPILKSDWDKGQDHPVVARKGYLPLEETLDKV